MNGYLRIQWTGRTCYGKCRASWSERSPVARGLSLVPDTWSDHLNYIYCMCIRLKISVIDFSMKCTLDLQLSELFLEHY